MPENHTAPTEEIQRQFFRKCLPMQVMLHETIRVLGDTEGQVCLDIGTSNGMLSSYLRRKGGTWHTAVGTETAAAAVRSVVSDNVSVLDRNTLPYKKQMFDSVVVFNYMERVGSDESFIEECHRVLRPDGRLIINVAHVKSWTPITGIRSLMGLTPAKKGRVRAGYTESQLFNILKHGFDVLSMRSYSRFFVELTDAFVESMAGAGDDEGISERRIARAYAIGGMLFKIAHQLDMLFLLTRGHVLVTEAKRRAWRPRNAPVLVDGRSISEAVLTKALD